MMRVRLRSVMSQSPLRLCPICMHWSLSVPIWPTTAIWDSDELISSQRQLLVTLKLTKTALVGSLGFSAKALSITPLIGVPSLSMLGPHRGGAERVAAGRMGGGPGA